MYTWHFARMSDGIFTGESFSASRRSRIEGNVPDGLVAVENVRDWLSQRVDVETGEIVDYQPPQPSFDHEWNAEIRRWVLKPEVVAAQTRRAAARSRIDELERKQARRVRELLAESDPQLKALDNEIAQQRAILNGGKETSEP